MYLNPENNGSTTNSLSPYIRLKKLHSVERYCFFCHNKIKFWFFYHCYSDLGPEKLAEIWQDSSFKLYCRSCFEELKLKNIQKFLGEKELRERYCWKCGKKLSFTEYLHRNLDISPKRLVELWQSSYVEIYCCNCHDRQEKQIKYAELMKKSENIKKNILDPKEGEALRFIEQKIGKKLPYLDHINYFGSFGFRQKSGHLIGLALSDCGLNAIPEEIRVFSCLEKLSMDRNPFKTLPSWISSLNHLKWVNIFNRELLESNHNLSILKQLQKQHPQLLIISKYYYSDKKFLNLNEKYLSLFSKLAYSAHD
ncbi:MAG: hypothetical protein ACOC44_01105 [Promethearchaeia archaeon]